ncbi:hypothetical protein YPPY58_2357, partial [Yersinia pestis PY-58]
MMLLVFFINLANG